ncbi:MAG: PorT family protein [Chitinophagales bacterium]|nr:PorT family protein [Chitinophagales bacterium]
MKKIVITLIICSAFTLRISAQEFRFGLTASPMFHWLSVDGTQYENDGTRVGFQYGLLFDQTIGDVQRYAFSSGLLINYASGSVTGTDTSLFSTNIVMRVQYIEIPVTIRLRTNEVNYMTYYGQFGVTPGFNIKARGDFIFEPDPFGFSIEDVDIMKDNALNIKYNLINLSLTLGAGMEYGISENTAIMAGLFFQNGFTNILDDDVDDNNARLKQIGIRLGVLF